MAKDFARVYNYDDCPTIRDFALSNIRQRLVMGPFGSGKSSGMVAEIVRRAHQQAPWKSDGIRRVRVAVVRNCYDDKTEVLTDVGWKLFKNLLQDDMVATLDKDELVYKKHNGIYCARYDGDMVRFESEGVDFSVTPEHKMYVSKKTVKNGVKSWNNFHEKTAEEIFGSQMYRVKRDAKWNNKNNEHTLAFMEWLGFFLAEGSANVYRYKQPHGEKFRTIYRCVITQKNNLLYVDNLFKNANIPYNKNKRNDGSFNYTVQVNKDTVKLIIQMACLGKANEKHVPMWVRDCSSHQIKMLIRGYLAGDGSHRKDGCLRATTASKRLADDMQELALKAGYVVNLSISDRVGKNSRGFKTNYKTWTMTFLCEKKYSPCLHVNEKSTNKLRGWFKEDYHGNVYCVNMPLVPVYVRRNGKAFWCYRTYRQLEDSTIKTFHYWLPPEKYGTWNQTRHDYIITAFPKVEIEVNFRALDRPDQVDNLLSVEYTFAWFNEYREIPWAVFEVMDGRIGRYPPKEEANPTWIGIIGDTNPPDEYSPYYKYFEGPYPNIVAPNGKPVNAKLWKQPSGLAPNAENIRNLPRNYYQNLARNKSDVFVNVYVHGRYGYIEEGRPVYAKSYNDNRHVSANSIEPIKGIPLITGWDFGLNPSVIIGQILPTGRVLILRAISSDGMGLERFCINTVIPMLRTEFFGFKLLGYGDPAGNHRVQTDEKTCYDIFQKNEIGFHDIEPAPTNDITPRINAAERQLNRMVGGEPAIIIDPSCNLLRKALSSGYRYKKIQTSIDEQYADTPEKNFFSHIGNAFEYFCMFVNDSSERRDRDDAFRKQINGALMRRGGSSLSGY